MRSSAACPTQMMRLADAIPTPGPEAQDPLQTSPYQAPRYSVPRFAQSATVLAKPRHAGAVTHAGDWASRAISAHPAKRWARLDRKGAA